MARGHVRQRGKSWEVRIYAGTDPLTGRERRITRTAPTLKAAEALRTRLLRELDDGAHAGPDATLGQLFAAWIEAKSPGWSPKNTLETQGYVDRWLAPPADHPRWHWAPGRQRLRDITPGMLNEVNRRLAAELAPATVRRIHGVTRAALEQAVRWDWITRNPAARCEPIEGGSVEVRPPGAGDVRLLLRATEGEPGLHLWVRLAVVTGRRRGELCALRWSDFDWAAGSVVVARTIVDGGPGQWIERPISKNTQRFPPMALDRRTLDLLSAHRTRTAALLAGLPADDHVFLTVTAGAIVPWSPDAASRRFSRACADAGLGDIHPHALRHLAATAMLDGGIALPTAGGRLGHGGGGRTTADVYAHQMPATDQTAADLLAALIDD